MDLEFDVPSLPLEVGDDPLDDPFGFGLDLRLDFRDHPVDRDERREVDGPAVGRLRCELDAEDDPRAFIRNGVLTVEVEA